VCATPLPTEIFNTDLLLELKFINDIKSFIYIYRNKESEIFFNESSCLMFLDSSSVMYFENVSQHC